ncbi:hypothetical protein Scep_021250 [Stephania cephalantha]|uniref:Uncharacterized protein n=1 Tax=Stephania cephalantha TaxID=152367 RepID=A0AAP0F332_9MAGN
MYVSIQALVPKGQNRNFTMQSSLMSSLCCSGIETPEFTVVYSEPDFEIRRYGNSSWISAPLPSSSFEKATQDGFHRLYQYIHGANTNSTQLKKTAPILTSVFPSAQGLSDFFVRLYVSKKFEGAPPQPVHDLNLQLAMWGSHCVAVRKFYGYAKGSTVSKEVEALQSSLSNKLQIAISSIGKNGFSVAQYNASFRLVGRLNEIWINISGVLLEGCLSN